MGPIGIFLAVAYVVLTVAWPLGKSMQFLWKQRWDLAKRLTYMGVAGALGAAVLAVAAFMPWKYAIKEPLVVLSSSDETLYVRTPGYVATVVHDTGDAVKKGEVILTLQDPELSTLLKETGEQREEAFINARRAAANNKPGELAAQNDAIKALDAKIDSLTKAVNDLVLRAPVDGVIIRETSLKRIMGNFVPPGMKLCRVIRTDKLEARISLPQQQAAMVQVGMPVRIRLWSSPGSVIQTRVARISSTLSDDLIHPALSSYSHGDVDVKANDKGEMKSSSRRSTVIIELPPPGPDEPAMLADGMTGRGEIVVKETTVAARVWRAIVDSTTLDWHL
jgi:multidrug resistance efflux pump